MNQDKPLFYREPIALNRDVHSTMLVGKSPSGYVFAAKTHSVILAPVEFFEACKEYPIIFSKSGDGTMVPVALVGIRAGENLFVDAKGAWQGHYVPAYVRRYPFILSDAGADNLTVCIDRAYDGIDIAGGEAIFTPEGGYSDFMKGVLELLRNCHVQFQNGGQFAARLEELGLFKAMDALFELSDGRNYALNGFFVVDEQRLQALADAQLSGLFRAGYLGLIYAHLMSLGTLNGLVDRLLTREEPDVNLVEPVAESEAQATAVEPVSVEKTAPVPERQPPAKPHQGKRKKGKR